MTADLAIGLTILVVIAGMCIWLYRAGGFKVRAKIAEQVIKDKEKFDELGEEWDDRGGLGGIVVRRVQRRKWKL